MYHIELANELVTFMSIIHRQRPSSTSLYSFKTTDVPTYYIQQASVPLKQKGNYTYLQHLGVISLTEKIWTDHAVRVVVHSIRSQQPLKYLSHINSIANACDLHISNDMRLVDRSTIESYNCRQGYHR